MEPANRRINSSSRYYEIDDRQFKPALKPVSPSCSGDSYSQTSDDSITKTQRQVMLTKSNDSSFGFNIIGGTMGEGIYISFILAGGPADISKKLYKGDQILKVNGHDISNLTHSTVVQLLKESGNKINLVVIYKIEEFRNCENHIQEFDDIIQSTVLPPISSIGNTGSLRTTSKKTLYVRALFNYQVNKDCGLPNKGLSFKFGDILHVTNASDSEWWQARKVNLTTGEDETDLGIIQSKNRVERQNKSKLKKVRICIEDTIASVAENDEYITNNTLSQSFGDIKLTTNSLPRPQNGKIIDSKKQTNGGLFSRFKGKSKNKCQTNSINQDSESDVTSPRNSTDSVQSYQPVIQEENSLIRPVIILGVAKEEINKSLLKEYNDEFGICVPHTTRPIETDDIDGKDFYFVSVDEMNELMSNHQFIETGRSGNFLYGTSVQSIIDVAEAGKHCILDISSMAIKRLYIREIWPITILIQVQSVDDYRSVTSKSVSEEQALKAISKLSRLEQEFLPFITAIISGSNFDSVYQQVIQTIAINNGRKVWLPSRVSL